MDTGEILQLCRKAAYRVRSRSTAEYEIDELVSMAWLGWQKKRDPNPTVRRLTWGLMDQLRSIAPYTRRQAAMDWDLRSSFQVVLPKHRCEAGVDDDELVPFTPSFEEEVERKEEVEAVTKVLERMPPGRSKVVLEREALGYTRVETMKLLGLSPGNMGRLWDQAVMDFELIYWEVA